MKGQIVELSNDSGVIEGEDGNLYFFSKYYLCKPYSWTSCRSNVQVQFHPDQRQGSDFFGNARAVKLECVENVDALGNDKSSLKPNTPLIEFYRPGYPLHFEKDVAFKRYLKKGTGQEQVIEKLSKVLYISKIGHHIIDQSSVYQFCLVGVTNVLRQFVRGKYEFLIIFSHYDSCDWQQKTLLVERELRRRREISDRRPLVNFYLLISNARELKSEIDKQKGGTGAAVIPFSFFEVFSCKTKEELVDLLISRFGEYLFENNMLGETNAIDDDNLLFGDRGKIADSIVCRCQQGNNSGIFGLRRSGKSSVLNAVLRRLERDSIKYVKIESRSGLETLDSWKTALYEIAYKIRQIVSSLEQNTPGTRLDFLQKLNLNSSIDDYHRRPTQSFVEDVKLYCQGEKLFVIAIDEVELITYNTANYDPWKNVAAYCGFWGALRDCGCALIVCGVNSSINEISSIVFNGEQGDNPMYGRIINCSDSITTYLPAFTDEQTKTMINTLGGYSNIAFSDVFSIINGAFGGQPYAIRQFCSYVFETIKSYRQSNVIYEVSKATIAQLLIAFSRSAKGSSLCEIILQHLTIFKDEYDMLRKLALTPENYKMIKGDDVYKIDHLEKYGLIEYDKITYFVTFKINLIKDYISRIKDKKPEEMNNDERRQFVQDYVASCERKLKKYVLNHFTYSQSILAGRSQFLSYIRRGDSIIRVNSKASPRPNPDTCDFNDFFDHKKFIMHFSSMKRLIVDNWATMGNVIKETGMSKEKFCACMDDLNAGRNDADHYDAEDIQTYPNGWEINDSTMMSFCAARDAMDNFFKAINLTSDV